MKRKRYSRKFQRMAVERLRTCDDVKELAQELGVTRRCLYKWRVKLETIEPGEDGPRPSTHTSSYRKQIHQLKRMLAEKAMEVDLLPVGRLVRAGPRGIFSRLDRFEFNAPLVQASPGHPQLLRQLIHIITGS